MTQGSNEVQLHARDLVVGQSWLGEAHTISEADFAGFATITGDAHPIHYDDAYAARTRFGRRVAHGLLLTSLGALGATRLSDQLRDAMIAFVEQSNTFLKPAFIGDVVTSRFEVAAVEQLTGKNVARVRFAVSLLGTDGAAITAGHHLYLFRHSPQTVSDA